MLVFIWNIFLYTFCSIYFIFLIFFLFNIYFTFLLFLFFIFHFFIFPFLDFFYSFAFFTFLNYSDICILSFFFLYIFSFSLFFFAFSMFWFISHFINYHIYFIDKTLDWHPAYAGSGSYRSMRLVDRSVYWNRTFFAYEGSP